MAISSVAAIYNGHSQQRRIFMKSDEFSRFVGDGDMTVSFNRLQTFLTSKWTNSISTHELSSAGFCFTGTGDNVVCFSCKGMLSSWEVGNTGNTPIFRHIKTFPQCKFARDIVRKYKHRSPSRIAFDHATDTATDINSNSSGMEDEIPSISHYNSEYSRLVSFVACPITFPVKVEKFSKAGFYHTDKSSLSVTCFACFVEIKEWKGSEEPMLKHRQVSPNCPFIQGLKTDNNNLTEDELKQVQQLFQRFNIQPNLAIPVQCTEFVPTFLTSEVDDKSQYDTNTSFKSKYDDPMYLTSQHKEYFRLSKRMKSFSNWPEDHFLRPEMLVKAGLFKSGNGDLVICFYCGVKLQHWKLNDDPLMVHVKTFSDCRWLEFQRSMIRVEEAKQHLADTNSKQKGDDIVRYTQQYKGIDQLTESGITSFVDMGFSEQVVKQVFHQRIKKGQPFHDTCELLDVILKKEEEEEERKTGKCLVPETSSIISGKNEQKIDHLTESEIAKSVIGMGFSGDIIEQVLRQRIESDQSPFQDTWELTDAILKECEEESKKGQS